VASVAPGARPWNAAVKGQLETARVAVTNQAETHLRNVQEELREEHVEIAIYTRLDALADEVGDRDTSRLAKAIMRDEQRMVRFLEAELRRLVKAVVRAEVPVDQRASGRPSKRAKRRAPRAHGGRGRRHASPAPS
jgi:hypothetical protein